MSGRVDTVLTRSAAFAGAGTTARTNTTQANARIIQPPAKVLTAHEWLGTNRNRADTAGVLLEQMRRLMIVFACAVAVIAVAPQVAAAKASVELRSGPPAALRAGDAWKAELVVHATARQLAAADPPAILINNDADGWTKIRATRVPGKPGAYTADVVFPSGGTWTYHVHDPIAGGGSDFDPVFVAAQRESGGGLALWLVVGSALFTAAAMVVRRRRFQLA